MAQAVQNTPVVTNTVVQKVLGKWVGFMNAFIREYPWFAYLGLGPTNWYKMTRNINGQQGGSLLQLEKFTDVSFAKISKIESTMSEDGKSVTWYEWESFSTSSEIAIDSTTTAIEVQSVSGFAVGDYVRTIPANWSTGTETQVSITAINTTTKVITVSAAVDVKAGDRLLFIAPALTRGNKVTREVADPNSKQVITYFQKFGWSVTMLQEDLNKTRLLLDAKDYIANQFNKPKMLTLESIINTWFFGQNVGGNTPQAQGLTHVIEEREWRGQTSVYDLSSITNDKLKIAKLQELLNLASTAPIYSGNEKPTVLCTTAFSANVARLLQDSVQYQNFIPKTIEYGLESLTTPYFRNINFLVMPEMDRIYGQKAVAFVIPKELVWFRVPENEIMDVNGAAVKTQANRFAVIPQPITTNDFREYTVEYWMANIFAGQSYDNAYMKIEWLI